VTGIPEADQTLRIRRTSVDSSRAEICRGNERTQQRAQTCGIFDDSDTANMINPSTTLQTVYSLPDTIARQTSITKYYCKHTEAD